jgi:CheY-like chemotaxis protein
LIERVTVSQYSEPLRLQILHVDDDPMNRRVVADILFAFGHQAFGAESGLVALEQLEARRFDLVLMDIQMSEMGGVEVVRRLRAFPGPERWTPVIALTAADDTRTRETYLRLGFQDLVRKPILVSELHGAINQVSQLYGAILQAVGEAPQADARLARRG